VVFAKAVLLFVNTLKVLYISTYYNLKSVKIGCLHIIDVYKKQHVVKLGYRNLFIVVKNLTGWNFMRHKLLSKSQRIFRFLLACAGTLFAEKLISL
jgi:hypothetical protein